MLVTANECHELARRCVDVSYFGKFNQHVSKLLEICKTDILILTHIYALVVSRPSVKACKDDMRFYMRDLLMRIKIGDLDMKRQALINLHEVVSENEKYVKVILEGGDIIHVLMNFLDLSGMEIQEESIKLVSVITGFNSYKVVLIGTGVIAPLSRVVECGSELAKIAATRCLMKLTENSDNAWSISAHRGVIALLIM